MSINTDTLNKIASASTLWVGPAWRQEQSITETMVNTMIASGELQRHPEHPENVRIAPDVVERVRAGRVAKDPPTARQRVKRPNSRKEDAPGAKGNGAVATSPSSSSPTPPPSLDSERQETLKKKVSLAQGLLLPNPDALNAIGVQLTIKIVKKLSPLEFFRTHPSLRLTLLMVTPDTEAIDPPVYGVMQAALPALRRERMEPYVATLYPLVIDTKPLTYKLLQVKPPLAGRKWDAWNLGRRVAAEKAIDQWIAMRSIPGGYEACEPDPNAIFPEAVFPEWSEEEWLEKSLGITGQIIYDDTHEIFKRIRHL